MTQKPFLQLVAEDIYGRFGNDLSDIAIVFNNKRPITYLKKHLAEVYGRAIWSPQFYTIQEFFKLSTSFGEASPFTQFFYLYSLHNELLIHEGRNPETLEEFYPIAEIILHDFSQLDYDLVPVDQIFMELYDTSKIDIAFQHLTEEQLAFIRQFWQSFSASGQQALQERFLRLWKRLPLLYRAFKDKLRQERQTNYPTIYRELAEDCCEDTTFLQRYRKVLFVGFNALNKAEARLFRHWQDTDKALFYFDADAYYLEDELQEAGFFIRRNINTHGLNNALGESPNIIGNRINDVHVYASTGKVSQTKLLYDLLNSRGKKDQSVAVLLADETLLIPLLQSLPDVEPNITTGYPLTQSPIFGIFDLWLEVHEHISFLRKPSIPYQVIETYINHPMTKVSPIDQLKMQDTIADKQLFELSLDELSFHSVLPDFFKPIANPSQVIPALVQIIDQLLETVTDQGRIQQINSNLLVETKKVLNQLQLGFEQMASLTIFFQIGLIRKALAPITSAIEGDPLKGLQIMGLLESRCLNFDEVYILGANEGILPQTAQSPTFIPDALRRAYGLPILENQNALSAYLFYRHFQYSTGIHLFYNSTVDENSNGEESRFIKQLEFESRFNFIKQLQQQPIRFAERPKELVIHKTGKIWETLYTDYVTKSKRLSATALTTYLHSPLEFFLKYVANIKEPPSLTQEFEMNKLGTVIHNVMEKIFLPFKGKKDFISTQKLKDSITLIDALLIQEIGMQYKSIFKKLEDLNSLQRIMHKIASEYVRVYLQYDVDNYKAFRIIELENDNDYLLPFPIMINGRTENLMLYGIIDRVDEVLTHDGRTIRRIVDYKTGGDTVEFREIEKVFAPNTENKALVQTLFYAYVYEQKTGLQHLEPHLYVARKMREDGTLFKGKSGTLTADYLAEEKSNFINFLKLTLEEIFNPNVPFRHHTEASPYPNDPYTLFYRDAITPINQADLE